MNIALPTYRSAEMPVNPAPAQVSYTSEELSLWQQLVTTHSRSNAVLVFERETGKRVDSAFLL
jgi:hypothetical protein